MQFFSFEPIIGNRAQIRRSILVNHTYALFILPQPCDTMPGTKKMPSCIFQRKSEWNDCILYMARNEETTSLTCSTFQAPYQFMWQNSCGKTSSFAKSRLLPKICETLQDHLSSFFFPEHNPAILIYIWPCSNIGFLFEDKLQGTLRVKKA